MTQETKTPPKSAAPADPAMQDLSTAIEQAVTKEPNEHVKCVRVFGAHYRCNWWLRDKSDHWMAATTGRISRSRFLRATKTGDQLVIEGL